MAQLRVTSAPLQGAVFALDGEYFTIGRAPGNHIQLPHPSISKQHAMLTRVNCVFKYWDLHSTNGTTVNGERTLFRQLEDGDRLVLGEIQLDFSRTSTGTPQPPPPVEINHTATQLIPGTVTKPRSLVAQSGATKATGRPPAPNTLIAVITPPPVPVAPVRPLPTTLSRLAPPQPEPVASHKELRAGQPIAATATCVEVPTPPKINAAVKASRHRLIYLVITMAGGITVGVGYSANNPALKFLGLFTAITGFIALLFTLRFGNILAPPRD
ncbi:MAG: hypothetical protein PCFJNLEI_03882 [Verrucomicrobiae bacterium]|nr:hypothetical protein [Verrucomicrobiae bacterium]